MAKINGTLVLVYADGTLIASQKSCTVTWDADLPDATDKSSAGWAEHINGTRSVTCDCDCLYNSDGLSAEELVTYITSRGNIMLVIQGGLSAPIVGKADVKSCSVNADMEAPVGVNASFQFTDIAPLMTGAFVNIVTDWNNTSYDTFTDTDGAITAAVDAGTNAAARSADTFNVVGNEVYKALFYLTLTSGELPSFEIRTGGALRSNVVTATAGVNLMTFTITANDSACYVRIYNTIASNFATSKIYLWKAY